MNNLRDAARQALESLQELNGWQSLAPPATSKAALEAAINLSAALVEDAMQKFTDVNQELEAALAEPQQEPVAWMDIDEKGNRLTVRQWSDGNRDEVPLYTAPPQRNPLSDEEIELAYRHIYRNLPYEFDHSTPSWVEQGIRYAERVHGIGESNE